jgi:hypothetical protein
VGLSVVVVVVVVVLGGAVGVVCVLDVVVLLVVGPEDGVVGVSEGSSVVSAVTCVTAGFGSGGGGLMTPTGTAVTTRGAGMVSATGVIAVDGLGLWLGG